MPRLIILVMLMMNACLHRLTVVRPLAIKTNSRPSTKYVHDAQIELQFMDSRANNSIETQLFCTWICIFIWICISIWIWVASFWSTTCKEVHWDDGLFLKLNLLYKCIGAQHNPHDPIWCILCLEHTVSSYLVMSTSKYMFLIFFCENNGVGTCDNFKTEYVQHID